jgi:hypothetical protein
MLTLASNERIPLTPSMRLLLEINHMNHCSPATVSRGGVVFINGACLLPAGRAASADPKLPGIWGLQTR